MTHHDQLSRRQALRTFANGFGMLGLAGLFASESSLFANAPMSPSGIVLPDPANPLGMRPPMYTPRAKRVIFLFMSGGPSHVDLFDPKPEIGKHAGKPLPFEQPKLVRTRTTNLLPSPWKFNKCGQSGLEMCEHWPHLSECADDLCVIRSMFADNINHNGACLQMNTGEQAFSRPSMGSWLTYGLGSENQNLPGFVVLSPAQPAQGAPLWSSSFLPASYQGTLVGDLKNPIANIANLSNPLLTRDRQRAQLDTLKQLNEMHKAAREEDSRPIDNGGQDFARGEDPKPITTGGQGTAREEAPGPLLAGDLVQDLRTRWDNVQTGFVDEPRAAVQQADELVAQAMKHIAESFSSERNRLEQQWDRGDDVNTEDLRQALRKYRAFFQRLLSV